MSFGDDTVQHIPGPDRLNPVSGTPILRASVEAKRLSDLCTGVAAPAGARERILAWLADGARELTWALCALPPERQAALPPSRLGAWSVLQHAHHLARREALQTLPAVLLALGESTPETPLAVADVGHSDHSDTAVDASAEEIIHGLGTTRFELLQRLEAAPDAVWQQPLPASVVGDPGDASDPVQLDWLLLNARQHELEHLAAIWKIALFWDRVSPTPVPGQSRDERAASLRLHPADRLEESH